MRKIWSRVVKPVHEYEIIADMSNDDATLRKIASNIVMMPNISKTANAVGLPVSTVHDNIKRLDFKYGLKVKVIVGK
jgi:hypothetical protein